MLHARVRWCGLVLNLFTQGLGFFVFGSSGIQRIRQTILFALPKMVHQQITGDACYPRHECAAPQIVRIQSAINFDEDLLREVLRVISRSCETIADVVNPPMVPLYDILPSPCVAGYTATDQQCYDLGVFQPALPGTPGLSEKRPPTETLQASTPQYRYVVVVQKFRTSDKARHFSRTDGWGEELTNKLGWFASPNAPWLWTPRGVMQALKFFEAVEPVPRINAVYARVKPAPRASFQRFDIRVSKGLTAENYESACTGDICSLQGLSEMVKPRQFEKAEPMERDDYLHDIIHALYG